MIVGTLVKQPIERRDRDVSLSKFFANRPGDKIDDVEFSVDDESIVVQIGEYDTTKIKVWFSGGLHGKTYKVTLLIKTEMGRIIEAEIRVRVREV